MRSNRRLRPALLCAALTAGTLLPSLASHAADNGLPPPNPFTADSVVSVFHGNTGQTGATGVPGPVGKTRQLAESDILWKLIGPGDAYSFQYSGPYPNGRRVGWFGGGGLLFKLDADTLDTVATYAMNRGPVLTGEELRRLVEKADTQPVEAALDTLVPTLTSGIERFVQTGYRLLDKDNNLFMLGTDSTTGEQYIRKFGDAVENDPDSPIAMKAEFRLPHAEGERIVAVAMNITYDGALIVVTLDGTLFAISRDFKLLDRIQLPGRENDSKEFMNSFVRNSIAIDQQGGVYIVSRKFMQRIQWTGSEFSLVAEDGAWSEPYASGERGSGTTPALLGWGDKEDKLVIIGDGEHSMMAFWRDRIPADWKGLPGQSRRVAAKLPMSFGPGIKENIKLENALVTMGNGVFVANDTPSVEVPWRGSFLATSVAEHYVGQTGGTEIRGGIKWEWNSKQRKLEVDWTTPLALVSSICTPNVNGLVYCVGMRDGLSTIEALDWDTGKSAFHYTLGKSYRYAILGGLVSVAPNGDVECGCAGGFGIIRVRTPAEDRPTQAPR